MKKKTVAVGVAGISVAVTSFGNDPIPLTLADGSTVADAIKAAGIPYSNQQLFVSGETAELEDVLESGDVLSIVTPKQAGTY